MDEVSVEATLLSGDPCDSGSSASQPMPSDCSMVLKKATGLLPHEHSRLHGLDEVKAQTCDFLFHARHFPFVSPHRLFLQTPTHRPSVLLPPFLRDWLLLSLPRFFHHSILLMRVV